MVRKFQDLFTEMYNLLKFNRKMENKNNFTIKVEIWSDVVCPFCYIGKHKFERALQNFSYKDNIEPKIRK